MFRFTRLIIPAIVTTAVVLGSYFWVRDAVTSRIYRDKLAALAADYAALAERYNHAVRQSAITELEVTETSVTVLIRTVDGRIRRVETPFDPNGEIFVDYLVGNGKIWIRRLFDAETPPSKALVVDPLWETVDWKRSGLNYGKVVYRALEPGIWSIRVSGNGSLSLEQREASALDTLVAAPPIRSFEEIRLSMEADLAGVGWGDLWHYMTKRQD